MMLVLFDLFLSFIVMTMGELLLLHELHDGVEGIFKTFAKIWLDTG
jgi:hypothetical protein